MTQEIDWKRVKVALFDCFVTVFDMSTVPREKIAAYVQHVRREDFTPYEFPVDWYDLNAHPDAKEGIGRLRRLLGVRCIAFSNGSWELIHRVSQANGIHWSGITSPAALQAYKPHLEAYQRVLGLVKAQPHECLMVSANEHFGDLEKSKQTGMQSILIDRQNKYPEMPHTIIELAEMMEEEGRK